MKNNTNTLTYVPDNKSEQANHLKNINAEQKQYCWAFWDSIQYAVSKSPCFTHYKLLIFIFPLSVISASLELHYKLVLNFRKIGVFYVPYYFHFAWKSQTVLKNFLNLNYIQFQNKHENQIKSKSACSLQFALITYVENNEGTYIHTHLPLTPLAHNSFHGIKSNSTALKWKQKKAHHHYQFWLRARYTSSGSTNANNTSKYWLRQQVSPLKCQTTAVQQTIYKFL